MVLDQIELRNFRNYNDLRLTLSPRFNWVYGLNGQGKTNLAEAVFYICNLDSFRTHHTAQLLAQTPLLESAENLPSKIPATANLSANLIQNSVSHQVQIEISRKGKKVVLDHKPVRKISDYIAHFYSLAFTPIDAAFFRAPPSQKRQFFDRTMAFVDPSYLRLLRESQEVVAQRNHLLRQKQYKALSPWNEMLASVSLKIHQRRSEWITLVNKILPLQFKTLTGRTEQLRLIHRSAFAGQDPQSHSNILKYIQESFQKERQLGYTLVGPQRDDFCVQMDEKLDREFFSQGELRIAKLSLNLSINQLLFEQIEYTPILIFDDLFSELDQRVHERVMQSFEQLQNQILITSTQVPSKRLRQGCLIEICEGQLTSQEMV